MTGFTHFNTGASIGLTISNPLLAGLVAIGSHFVLDTFPHYGEDSRFSPISDRRWKSVIITDVLLLIGIVGYFVLSGSLLPLLFGFLAMTPDIPFIVEEARSRFFGVETDFKGRSLITQFHSKIQTLERPRGWILEIVYAVTAFVILFSLL